MESKETKSPDQKEAQVEEKVNPTMETPAPAQTTENEKTKDPSVNLIVAVTSNDIGELGDDPEKKKRFINVINLSEDGPEYLSLSVTGDERWESLKMGEVNLAKGSKLEVSGYLKAHTKGERTNHYLNLISQPSIHVEKRIEVKGFVANSKGIVEMKGKGYQYEKQNWTIGIPDSTGTIYHEVSAKDNFYDEKLEKGQEVLISGIIENKPWSKDEKRGINTKVRITEKIIVGKENIQKHLQSIEDQKQNQGKSM